MSERCRKNPQKTPTSLKDWPRIFKQIEGLRGVSLEERALLAQGLAATPEERLMMHDRHLRALGLYSHWDREKLGLKK